MREINRGELHRARLGSQRSRPLDRLADRFPAVCRHQPSQRALSLSTGQTFRGERCETDNAHEADESMQKEAEKFIESLLFEKKKCNRNLYKVQKMHFRIWELQCDDNGLELCDYGCFGD